MNLISASVLAAGLALPLAAQAQDAGEALVKKNGCLKCHSVSADKDGPSFKKSAAKYKGQADKLQAFLKQGSKEHKPMKGGDADIKQVADYILSR
jgi:cytochrome c